MLRRGAAAVVTKTIGIDRTTLRQELRRGKTIAEIATANDVSPAGRDRRARDRREHEARRRRDRRQDHSGARGHEDRSEAPRPDHEAREQLAPEAAAETTTSLNLRRLASHLVTPERPSRRRTEASVGGGSRPARATGRRRRASSRHALRGGRASVFPGYVALQGRARSALDAARRPHRRAWSRARTARPPRPRSSPPTLGDDVATNQRRRQPARRVGQHAARRRLVGAGTGPVVLEVDESYLPAALDAAPTRSPRC